jgi:hypothetical protein
MSNSFLPRNEDLSVSNKGISWDEFSKNLANYGIGMTEMPAETARFIADLVTMGQVKMGIQSPEQAQQQFIHNQQETERFKPLQHIAPEYDNWVKNQENADIMRSLGNIGGGAMIGGLFKEPIKAMGVSLKKPPINPSIITQLNNWGKDMARRHAIAVGALAGGSRQAFGEVVTEPTMEEARNNTK